MQCSESQEQQIPTCATNIFPLHGEQVAENSTVTLSWNGAGRAQVYDVFLAKGSEQPAAIASNISTTSVTYTLPPGADITYTWYVQPKNSSGAAEGCSAGTTTFLSKSLPAFSTQKKVVKVLVLNYDPIMTINGGTERTHTYFHWADPHLLAEGYINSVLTASDSLVQYNIVEWRDLDEFPVKWDGFQYTPATYLECISDVSKNKCHGADGVDYLKIVEKQNVVQGINENHYEEVWFFGGPYFGFWEAAMAGPKSFNINGDTYPTVKTNKAFAIMGFNYEREVAEMMHDLCHRTEATMSKVYGGWSVDKLTTSWAKFAANATQSKGQAAVGSCHYPPNAKQDYDYMNSTMVMSAADDWYNYPYLTGTKKSINSEAWGGPDYHLGYMKWWFSHLPRREGIAPDGKLNNWWRYIFEFNDTVLK
jgi:hypothetical protein